jgi:hypothetical protein
LPLLKKKKDEDENYPYDVHTFKKKKDEAENYPYDVHTFKKTGDNLIMKNDIINDDFELWEIYK